MTLQNDRDDKQDDEPRRPKRRTTNDDDDDFDDDEEERPRRGRARSLERDATGGIIPYKNPKALLAYYLGIFGLIPCFFSLGFFGIIPIILGFLGLKYARENPEASGKAHAIVGISLGLLEVLYAIGIWATIVFVVVTKK